MDHLAKADVKGEDRMAIEMVHSDAVVITTIIEAAQMEVDAKEEVTITITTTIAEIGEERNTRESPLIIGVEAHMVVVKDAKAATQEMRDVLQMITETEDFK